MNAKSHCVSVIMLAACLIPFVDHLAWMQRLFNGRMRGSTFIYQTRKSSCVNARGIPTAAYQVLLSGVPPPCQGTPRLDLAWVPPQLDLPPRCGLTNKVKLLPPVSYYIRGRYKNELTLNSTCVFRWARAAGDWKDKLFEFSRNTQSWQCWHFCTTSNLNKLEAVKKLISLKANLHLPWCFEF